MNLSQILDELCRQAVTAALGAGNFIASCQEMDVSVIPKEGGDNLASSVVTEVDFQSQEMILNSLKEISHRYGIGLLTEELDDDSSRFEKEAFWCIDPLDGTLPFTESVPGYAVSIGLVDKRGQSLIGVVYDPLSSTLYAAVRGKGAFKNGSRWIPDTEAQADEKGQYLTWMTDRDQEDLPFYRELTKRLEEEALNGGYRGLKKIHLGGAVLNACWCLEHSPALYFKIPKSIKGGGCFWDFAATACIIEEAGGTVMDFIGRPLNLNAESPYMNEKGVLFLSSPRLSGMRALLQEFNPLLNGQEK